MDPSDGDTAGSDDLLSWKEDAYELVCDVCADGGCAIALVLCENAVSPDDRIQGHKGGCNGARHVYCFDTPQYGAKMQDLEYYCPFCTNNGREKAFAAPRSSSVELARKDSRCGYTGNSTTSRPQKRKAMTQRVEPSQAPSSSAAPSRSNWRTEPSKMGRQELSLCTSAEAGGKHSSRRSPVEGHQKRPLGPVMQRESAADVKDMRKNVSQDMSKNVPRKPKDFQAEGGAPDGKGSVLNRTVEAALQPGGTSTSVPNLGSRSHSLDWGGSWAPFRASLPRSKSVPAPNLGAQTMRNASSESQPSKLVSAAQTPRPGSPPPDNPACPTTSAQGRCTFTYLMDQIKNACPEDNPESEKFREEELGDVIWKGIFSVHGIDRKLITEFSAEARVVPTHESCRAAADRLGRHMLINLCGHQEVSKLLTEEELRSVEGNAAVVFRCSDQVLEPMEHLGRLMTEMQLTAVCSSDDLNLLVMVPPSGSSECLLGAFLSKRQPPAPPLCWRRNSKPTRSVLASYDLIFHFTATQEEFLQGTGPLTGCILQQQIKNALADVATQYLANSRNGLAIWGGTKRWEDVLFVLEDCDVSCVLPSKDVVEVTLRAQLRRKDTVEQVSRALKHLMTLDATVVSFRKSGLDLEGQQAPLHQSVRSHNTPKKRVQISRTVTLGPTAAYSSKPTGLDGKGVHGSSTPLRLGEEQMVARPHLSPLDCPRSSATSRVHGGSAQMGWHSRLCIGQDTVPFTPTADAVAQQPAHSNRWDTTLPPQDPRQGTGGPAVQEDRLLPWHSSMPPVDSQQSPLFEVEPVRFPSSPFVNLSVPHGPLLQHPATPSTHSVGYGPWATGPPTWQPPLPANPPPPPPSPPPPPPLPPTKYDESSSVVPRFEFPRTMSEIRFGLIGGPEDRDLEKAQFSELARALSAEGAVYILYPAPNSVNVLAFTSVVCSGGLEGLPDFVLNKYVDKPVTFLRGLEYLQECVSQNEKGEQGALPALNPFSALYPSGVIVVSDMEALVTVPDPCSTLEELLNLLVMGKHWDPTHGWCFKINLQTWNQMDAARSTDAVVQGLWNVLHKEAFQGKVFQVMTKLEESSKPVADPPKAVRDAVKIAFQHRHDVRWVFFMHPDPTTLKSEEDRRQCQKYVQSAQSQTTLVAETTMNVVARVRRILTNYYGR